MNVGITLQRGNVFLAGEKVRCTVCFTNNATSPTCIHWASVQLICLCTVTENYVDISKEVDIVTPSFNRGSGFAPLSTTPHTLLSDVTVIPGESLTYNFEETLPCEAPATFRGKFAKYSYKLTLGVQRDDCEIQLMKIPFRVLYLAGLTEFCRPQLHEDDLLCSPSNPFLEVQAETETMLETALHLINHLTRKNANSVYNISSSSGPVCRLYLPKLGYRLGDEIVGILQFDSAEVRCVQVSVALHSDEVLSEKYATRPDIPPHTTIHACQEKYCLDASQSTFSLPVPLSAAPSFSTNIVSLNWKLHFEFKTLSNTITSPQFPHSPTERSTWSAPESISCDLFPWELTINIYPTSPLCAVYAPINSLTNTTVISV